MQIANHVLNVNLKTYTYWHTTILTYRIQSEFPSIYILIFNFDLTTGTRIHKSFVLIGKFNFVGE